MMGDREAFAELHARTVARVHVRVVRVLRDVAQAEEVVQEVYLDLWLHAAKYDRSKSSLVGYLLMMGYRRAISCIRSAEAARTRDHAWGRRMADREFDRVSETVLLCHDAAYIRRALDVLPAIHRDALSAAYLAGNTHQQTASILAVPLGTAKGRIRDGIHALRRNIDIAPVPI